MSIAGSLVGGGVTPVTIFLSFIVLVVSLLILVRRGRFVYALRNVPSPPALPFIGNAFQLNCPQEDFFRKLLSWSEKYGDIFLVWVGMRPFIWLYRVESVQPILSSTVHIDKSIEYRYLSDWLGTGLVTSDGEKWHARRKLLTSSFHNGVIEKYLGSSIREANVLVSRLRAEIGKPEFDVVPYAKLAALDVICDTAMGYHMNAQTNCGNEYVLAVDKMTSIVQKRFITFWAHPDILFNRTSWATEQQAALEVIHNFTNKVIAERKAEWKLKHDGNFNETPRKRQALLDHLLEVSQCGNTLLTDEDIREEVNTFMFAGHDTVATSVSWILYALGRHPKYQKKILQEYRSVIGCNEITMDGLKKLEFLDACMKESWRLYPAVPLIARQIYSPIKIMKTEVPTGSTVLVNTYILHRDPRHFPRPEVFYPERFLSQNAKPQPFTFVPFSAGSRNCIGWKFAQMEVKVFILSVLKAFEVRAVEDEEQLRLVSELVLVNKNGVRLTIMPRNYDGICQ
ncbi:cytochrome P450 4c3 isoform X1 [Neodiprion pinetum]|uniref:cytochrome P450 4c3 isoform X1 n=2 Tax=Neodiprion pinetum TaxID=441929 RepID=UPI001EDFC2CE|nr:cytochrome P450 4c3-like isoform X1 [Neodiprion pinetum]